MLRHLNAAIPLLIVTLLPSIAAGQSQRSAGVAPDTASVGYLRLEVTLREVVLDSFFVVIDGRFDEPYLVSRDDSLDLAVGTRHVLISARGALDSRSEVEIRPGLVTWLRSNVVPIRDVERIISATAFPVVRMKANVTVFSEEDADIYIDGEYVGTGVAAHFAPRGIVSIQVRTAGGSRTQRVFLRDHRMHADEVYVRPKRATTYLLGFLPGAAQYYRGNTLRAGFITAAFLGSGAFAYHQRSLFEDQNADFEVARRAYQLADTEVEAHLLGDRADRLHRRATSTARRANIALGLAGTVYVLNLIDALRTPSTGFRTTSGDPQSLLSPIVAPGGIGLQVDYRF